MSFETCFPVRFGDVDHARVMYLPRYFHLFHQTLEEWFGEALQIPYAELVNERNLGFPTVHADTRFRAPLRYGDRVAVALHVQRISARSLVCVYTLRRETDRAVMAEATITTVCVDNATFAAVSIPDDVRAKIEAYIEGQEAPIE